MSKNRRQKQVAQLTRCWKAQCPPVLKKPCWLRNNEALPYGLDIHGFFLSEIGLGHSARLYYEAIRTQEIEVQAINRKIPGREAERKFETIVSSSGSHNASLSIDGLVGFGGLSREICRTRHNIALPLWELEMFPERRIRNLSHFDELWAPSTFIKENLERATKRNVALVKHPIHIPDGDVLTEKHTGPLRILFFFDFDSFPARKNPEGAIRAFQAAFYKSEDVVLTIKTRGAADSGRRSWLAEQASRDNRITILDRTLSSESISRLMQDHDVFLSLHRSEGFGLGCAEALAFGNTVIATDYGGTCDFINTATGFPVDWKRIGVGEGEYVEAEGGSWADPSIEHAACLLREVYDAPELARKRALLGREELRLNHSVEVIGRRIRNLLVSSGVVVG